MPSSDVSAFTESVSRFALSVLDSDTFWSSCFNNSASSFSSAALYNFLSGPADLSVTPSSNSPLVLGSDTVWSSCFFNSASSFSLVASSDFLSGAAVLSVTPSSDSPLVLGSDTVWSSCFNN